MMKKVTFFLTCLLITFSFTFSTTSSAISNPKTIRAFEEHFFMSDWTSDWLAQNKLITYKNNSYIHIRDAANFLGYNVEVNSGDIYLTTDPSISRTNIVEQLPKESVNITDYFYTYTYIPSYAGMVIEDGNIYNPVYQKNAHAALYPASTVKIMTALLALEKGNLNSVVTVKNSAFNIPSNASKAGLRAGDRLTLRQLLYALLLPSGSDAARAIAEHIGGTEANFVSMMNNRAKSLGAKNTSFVNSYGYHNKNLYTTAYDLAIIANEVAKYPEFLKIAGTSVHSTSYKNRNGNTVYKTWRNTNEVINTNSKYYIPSVIGGKTGSTSQARFNLVSFAKYNDYQYISVVLRGERNQRFIDTKNLLNDAYAKRSEIENRKKSMYVVPFRNKIFVDGRQLQLDGKAFTTNYTTFIAVPLLKELVQSSNVTLSNAQEIKASLNGELLSFGQSKPVIQNGRMLVPARTMFEKLGLSLIWHPESRKVEIFSDNLTIELTINNNIALVNGQAVTLDVSPTIQNGRTLVPLRFVSETAGANVDWGMGRTIYFH